MRRQAQVVVVFAFVLTALVIAVCFLLFLGSWGQPVAVF